MKQTAPLFRFISPTQKGITGLLNRRIIGPNLKHSYSSQEAKGDLEDHLSTKGAEKR